MYILSFLSPGGSLSSSWIFLWLFRVFYWLCGASPFRSKMNCIPEALNLVITSALLLGTTSQALPKRLFMLDCETGQAAKALSAEWMFLDSSEQVWPELKRRGKRKVVSLASIWWTVGVPLGVTSKGVCACELELRLTPYSLSEQLSVLRFQHQKRDVPAISQTCQYFYVAKLCVQLLISTESTEERSWGFATNLQTSILQQNKSPGTAGSAPRVPEPRNGAPMPYPQVMVSIRYFIRCC